MGTTPRPWSYGTGDNCHDVYDANGAKVCHVYNNLEDRFLIVEAVNAYDATYKEKMRFQRDAHVPTDKVPHDWKTNRDPFPQNQDTDKVLVRRDYAYQILSVLEEGTIEYIRLKAVLEKK